MKKPYKTTVRGHGRVYVYDTGNIVIRSYNTILAVYLAKNKHWYVNRIRYSRTSQKHLSIFGSYTVRQLAVIAPIDKKVYCENSLHGENVLRVLTKTFAPEIYGMFVDYGSYRSSGEFISKDKIKWLGR